VPFLSRGSARLAESPERPYVAAGKVN